MNAQFVERDIEVPRTASSILAKDFYTSGLLLDMCIMHGSS